MIIWLNGAYGCGKSAVALELNKLISNSFIYNPENAGNFIRENLPDAMWKDDFQDYPLWRELNYQMIHQLAAECQTIIVPMTIIKPASFEEIIARLAGAAIEVRHFMLQASEGTLRQRLRGRGEKPGSWCEGQISRCIAAFQNDIPGTIIDTENKSAFHVAKEIRRATQ